MKKITNGTEIFKNDYSIWIAEQKKKWIGKKVTYEGEQYTVIGVDYNGGLLIDKKAQFTETTAVGTLMVKKIER